MSRHDAFLERTWAQGGWLLPKAPTTKGECKDNGLHTPNLDLLQCRVI
jgi:hypothetical protein